MLRTGAAGVVLWGCAISVALANPLVDEGRHRFENADFRGALAALEEAERAPELSRDELIALLETRALAYLGLQDSARVGEALRALASVDPGHGFSPEVPPEIIERFAALRADSGIEVTARATVEGQDAVIAASAEHDPSRLVRSLRIAGRVAQEEWQQAEGPTLRVHAHPGSSVEWYAQALGPGGAVLAHRGDEAAPEQIAIPRASGSDDTAWIVLGVVAAIAAVGAAAIIIGVLAQPSSPSTLVNGPIVHF